MRISRFGSDFILVTGHWLHRQLDPVMNKERSHDLVACVMGLG
jgi:hypothetical protein